MSKASEVIRYLYNRGYRVSDDGRLTNPKGVKITIKIKSNHKYPQTQAKMNGEKVNYLVHRLAAYCFYGEEMFREGIVVRHLNGNTLDVSRKNIALGTPSENEQDKDPAVRSKNASAANKARKETRRLSLRKLSIDDVLTIKKRLLNGEKGVDIAKDFGVVKDTIYEIKRGNRYKDIM